MENTKPILAQMWGFIKERGAWWILPVLVMLILATLLIIFAHSSPLSPFIYALF